MLRRTTRRWFTVSLSIAAMTSFTACELDLDDEGELELGETAREVESYFCVDHPCPDLDPMRYSECFRWGNYMPVAIDNTGPVGAGASKARFWVDYYGYARTYDVPAITAGSRYNLWIALPSGCLTGPGCSWGLLADSTNLVTEINGGNNTVRGACVY